MEPWSTERTGSTKANGSTTSAKAKAWRGTQTETDMRVILSKEKRMARVCITGLTERSTTANGKMESKKATECGKVFSVTATSVSGKTVKPMVMEYISGRMEIDSKVAGRTVSSTEKDLIYLRMEMSTLETMNAVSLKGMVYTSGRTEAYILVTLRME